MTAKELLLFLQTLTDEELNLKTKVRLTSGSASLVEAVVRPYEIELSVQNS
jgi:hypothetical protein